jgi:ATPase subunit of ABC transporter with duplicated ATPase domains
MGENGAGKSTLLKMLVGEVQPDAGSVSIGASVELGWFAQHQMEQLTEGRTVIEELESSFPTANRGILRNLLGAFGFSGDSIDKPIDVLSGGERSRVVLARLLFANPNLLVLDEPTNHLDLLTKRALVKALGNFQGTLIFVSHDRAFLRAVADRVLELSPGQALLHPGSYDDYVQRYGREAPGMRA